MTELSELQRVAALIAVVSAAEIERLAGLLWDWLDIYDDRTALVARADLAQRTLEAVGEYRYRDQIPKSAKPLESAMNVADAKFCCDKCGQPLLGADSRCNSGIHEGPDADYRRGRAVPIRTPLQRRKVAEWLDYYRATGGDV